MNNLPTLPSGAILAVSECGVLEANSVMELSATATQREGGIQ